MVGTEADYLDLLVRGMLVVGVETEFILFLGRWSWEGDVGGEESYICFCDAIGGLLFDEGKDVVADDSSNVGCTNGG